MSEDAETKLAEMVEEAMNTFIGRLDRAQRLSGVRAPDMRALKHRFVDQSRLARLGSPAGSRELCREEAKRMLDTFVSRAQEYRQETFAGAPKRTWGRYEDQKLRKPIARLVQFQTEWSRWEAMRRLRGGLGFNLRDGSRVQIVDWSHTPLFHTISR